MNIIEKDSLIRFPEVCVLKASAGSGKTWALTLRFVQLLLSEKVQGNHPLNIIALTFSNNAAREMKERILNWLKRAALEPDSKEAARLSEILDLSEPEALSTRAATMVEELLKNYSELQVMTIDSFLATLFKASSIELGIPPEFDIELDREELFRYSFDLFLRDIQKNSKKRRLLEETVDRIMNNQKEDSAYLWNPAERLIKEIIELHGKLTSFSSEGIIAYRDDETEELMKECSRLIDEIINTVQTEGFSEYRRSNLWKIKTAIDEGRYPDLLKINYGKLTVKKPSRPKSTYQRLQLLWEELKKNLSEYARHYMETYYSPYLSTYREFLKILEETKRLLGRIVIDDISYKLSRYLVTELIPDVYLRYGERINHFLIDEFQDTSPLQWTNLFPLIENSLSEGGSLFVVGDTKQAIYGFRNADYRIMKEIEQTNPFPSARHEVKSLQKNFRSSPEILEYVDRVFKDRLPQSPYFTAAQLSGLTDFQQDSARHERGYVEVYEIQRDEQTEPERQKLIDIIKDLKNRGYQYRDIAVLTMENYDVVRLSSWLSEEGIPFLSYSSLDIRRRKLTLELIALLEFLDSPTEDFALSTFLLGQVFQQVALEHALTVRDIETFLFKTRDNKNRYVSFREAFPQLWSRYFERLFRLSGYLPLYDLVIEALRTFSVFEHFREEEATLVRFLEVVKEFESRYGSDLNRFLSEFRSSRDKELWNIQVPEGTNAVNIMTVHKSKGLGFQAVVFIAYEKNKNQGFPYIINHDTEGVTLLKLNRTLLSINPCYEHLYQEELYRRQTDELNALYVALTRAKRELHLLCVKNKDRENYPFNVLVYPYRSDSPKPVLESQELKETVPELYYPSLSPALYGNGFSDIEIGARKRGEFVHAILSTIHYDIDLQSETLLKGIKRYLESFSLDIPLEQILNELTRFVYSPDIHRFFKQRQFRTVLTEQEVVDRWGNLYRIDRLIIDPELIQVIDFKTGTYDEEQLTTYKEQIGRYMELLRGIYCQRPVKGYVVSFENRQVIAEI